MFLLIVILIDMILKKLDCIFDIRCYTTAIHIETYRNI